MLPDKGTQNVKVVLAYQTQVAAQDLIPMKKQVEIHSFRTLLSLKVAIPEFLVGIFSSE